MTAFLWQMHQKQATTSEMKQEACRFSIIKHVCLFTYPFFVTSKRR